MVMLGRRRLFKPAKTIRQKVRDEVASMARANALEALIACREQKGNVR